MLLPVDPPPCFTNGEPAAVKGKPAHKVAKLTDALERMELLDVIGRKGNA